MSRFALGELPDPELVKLAKAGDQQAYSELYRHHSPMATRVIRRMTRHTEDAEDVLQEAFLRALRHLHSFDGRAAFSTWLTRIAVNCALMLLRRRRAHPESSIDINLDGGESLAFDMRDFSQVQSESVCRTKRPCTSLARWAIFRRRCATSWWLVTLPTHESSNLQKTLEFQNLR